MMIWEATLANTLSSLYPRNGMVATAGLGGALSGISLAQGLADARRSDRDSDLENLKRQFEFEQAQKDAPVRDIERQVKTNQGNLTNDLFNEGLPQEQARGKLGLDIDETKEARKRVAAAELIRTASKWEGVTDEEIGSVNFTKEFQNDIQNLQKAGVRIPSDAPPQIQAKYLQKFKESAIADMGFAQKRSLANQNFGFESTLQQNRIRSAEKIAGDRNDTDLQVADKRETAARLSAAEAKAQYAGNWNNTGDPLEAKDRMITAKKEQGIPLDSKDIDYSIEVARAKAQKDKNATEALNTLKIEFQGKMGNKEKLEAEAKKYGVPFDKKNPPTWEAVYLKASQEIIDKKTKEYLIGTLKSATLNPDAEEAYSQILTTLSGKKESTTQVDRVVDRRPNETPVKIGRDPKGVLWEQYKDGSRAISIGREWTGQIK